MTDEQILNKLIQYCDYYKIPRDFLFDILEDQKVVPMIRGKATEYQVYTLLKGILNPHEWVVAKLNLNAQNGMHDEDVTITHQRTGVIIKVECKNATRGSMKIGTNRTKNTLYRGQTYCTIKCHKSRSDLSKADTTNDRYLVDDFDIVISNMSNAVIAGATYSENFELIDNPDVITKLADFYNCNTDYQSIFDAAFNDWRFAFAKDIATEGVIPRTPYVLLENDPVWKPIENIADTLELFARQRRQRGTRR